MKQKIKIVDLIRDDGRWLGGVSPDSVYVIEWDKKTYEVVAPGGVTLVDLARQSSRLDMLVLANFLFTKSVMWKALHD